MRKTFISIFLALTILPVIAENSLNTVFLDLNANEIHEYKSTSPEIENMSINNDEDNNEDYIYHPMKYIKDEAKELYSSKTITNKKEKKFGKAKVGVKYNTTLAPESITQKRTLYTNYKVTEKMSVGADYQTNSMGGAEAQKQGTVGVGPEYQLNKKVKLKNKYSKNLGDKSNKGELSVEYKPFKDDRMDFSAGAAQIQQDDGTGSRSQVNFGTNIRF